MQLSGCIITDQDDKILLLHRTNPREQWEVPGGKIEKGEDSRAAAIREINEELGVSVKIDKLLGQKKFTEDNVSMNYFWYKAEIMSGKPKIMEPEKFNGFKYFSTDELLQNSITISIGTQNFLAMLKSKI